MRSRAVKCVLRPAPSKQPLKVQRLFTQLMSYGHPPAPLAGAFGQTWFVLMLLC
jgi:hypothetical protein